MGKKMQGKERSSEQYYPGSVMLSDHIKSLVDEGLLIVDDTFDEQQLRTAKYDARLGKAYFKATKFGNLDDSNPLLQIAPYELVFVESYEIFKLPKNITAKYDLRISGCLGGIGLQTGLQIDPSYYGRIFSPLFNFSDTVLILKYKEHLVSVEFSYTTPPTSQTKPFQSERQGLLSLSQALPSVPRRSGLEKLWVDIKEMQEILDERLKNFEDVATRLHTRVDTMVATVYGAMAFMIAALGVIAAAISIVVVSDIKVGAFPIAIGVIVFVGVVAGVLILIRKTIRKISEGN